MSISRAAAAANVVDLTRERHEIGGPAFAPQVSMHLNTIMFVMVTFARRLVWSVQGLFLPAMLA